MMRLCFSFRGADKRRRKISSRKRSSKRGIKSEDAMPLLPLLFRPSSCKRSLSIANENSLEALCCPRSIYHVIHHMHMQPCTGPQRQLDLSNTHTHTHIYTQTQSRTSFYNIYLTLKVKLCDSITVLSFCLQTQVYNIE